MAQFFRTIGRGIRSVGRGVAIVGGWILEAIHVVGGLFKAITHILD